jgi:hypothetical protein
LSLINVARLFRAWHLKCLDFVFCCALQVIKETVLASFPYHDFLGEEDVPPGKAASAAALEDKLATARDGWLWIVGTPSTILDLALNVE